MISLRVIIAVLALVVVLAMVLVVRDRVVAQSQALVIEVVSSRPDAVTGGDARIRVLLPPAVDPAEVRVTLGDRDVTASLRAGDGQLEGVLTGLEARINTLQATAPAAQAAVATLTNHPRAGPLLAGPHEQPFVCQTQSYALVGGQTLGKPLDADCSIKPRTDYVYRSKASGRFLPLSPAAQTDPSQRPTDLATFQTSAGTVPFIVRVETRTINRGVAQVAMLDDPTSTTRTRWNGKLLYNFGGGCDAGWYVQGTSTAGVLFPRLLSEGYAVASNSLNVFGQNCNDLLATETMAMTREQFIEDHGAPGYTMGIGCSGGSYQAHQIADNYPGLLDGIVVGCSFADVGFDTAQKLFDARLLASYARNFPGRLTPEQVRRVSGFGSVEAVAAMGNAANRMDPKGAFSPAVPVKDRYDPASNPKGARSTIWDHTANVYGRFVKTGFARRPIDNVGVQYGLAALQSRSISVDQFLALNEGIGGLDIDLRPTPERTTADSTATRAAYATGRLLNGGGGLGNIPIIDVRSYTEGPRSTDLHMRYHTFVTQARLIAANGDAENAVLLTVPGTSTFDLEQGVVADSISAMDRWIDRVRDSGRIGHRSVVDAKPADLVDACWTPAGVKIVERQTYAGPGQCNRLYPSHSAPRLVAGEPLTADVISCTLRPVDVKEYGQPLTAVQLAKLNAVFPGGVCDWTVPGRFQQPPTGPWIFIK
ncbi:MAG: DUF6351 family protein [Propionibacteriaceae bacterium]